VAGVVVQKVPLALVMEVLVEALAVTLAVKAME
jgi:hypothetical protein